MDPDEKIEVLLALNKYGHINYNDIINQQVIDIDIIIDNIIKQKDKIIQFLNDIIVENDMILTEKEEQNERLHKIINNLTEDIT